MRLDQVGGSQWKSDLLSSEEGFAYQPKDALSALSSQTSIRKLSQRLIILRRFEPNPIFEAQMAYLANLDHKAV